MLRVVHLSGYAGWPMGYSCGLLLFEVSCHFGTVYGKQACGECDSGARPPLV